MFNAKQHSLNSTLREIIVEHQFVGAALKALWTAGIIDTELLRSEIDSFGYDLVVTRGDVVRHVQLKSGLQLKPVGISRLLSEKSSGCVIFIQINDQLDMGPYFWFGCQTGEPFPEIASLPATKRTTPNSSRRKPARRHHHDVPPKLFTKVNTIEELLETLLGKDLSLAR